MKRHIIDRLAGFIDPRAEFSRMIARQKVEMLANFPDPFGHGPYFTGSSHTKRSIKTWVPGSANDPNDEVTPELHTLRARSRDLYKNDPIAGGAIRTAKTNIVGSGLALQSLIDYETLGITEDEADVIENSIEKAWNAWANSTDCDAGRRLNFSSQQGLAFLSAYQSGEVFAILPYIPRMGTVSGLRVQLLEADRCCTPDGMSESAKMQDGIELGDYGEPVMYHFLKYPLGRYNWNPEWVHIPAFGEKTGRPNVVHVYQQERPGQCHGIPYLTPVIEKLKQISDYTDAELQAAVLSAFFTVFVKSPTPEAGPLGSIGDTDEEDIGETGPEMKLGPGAIIGLGEGEDITTANPGRPNAQFDPFVSSLLRQIGMGLELPYELLVKQFTASFSASRAAILEAWKRFKSDRIWFAKTFCQPIFEEFLAWSVIEGTLSLPGFFDDESIRRAYCGADWIGPTPGQINPVDETNAAVSRVNATFSTRAEETAQYGGDWQKKIRQLAKEQKIMDKLGLTPPPAPGASAGPSAPGKAPVVEPGKDKKNGGNDDENQDQK